MTTNPIDITFKFKDSCNCCGSSLCCKRERPVNQRVYVNSSGLVEKYKTLKVISSSVETSFKRSLSNLHLMIETKVESFEGNPLEFKSRINHILFSIDNSHRITLAHVDAINDVMLQYLTEFS